MKIEAKEHISSGFSAKDAEIISLIINKGLESEKSVEIDFKDIRYFTTLFFNLALTSLLDKMSNEEYQSRIKIINLSEVGQETYEHSYENAVEYYKLSEDERREREKRISETTNMM